MLDIPIGVGVVGADIVVCFPHALSIDVRLQCLEQEKENYKTMHHL